MIFDIQRTCLHDGPGIRTSVFFKGCPLRCLWCHNPESRSFQVQISFNPEKCAHCLACVQACQYGAQKVVDGRHEMDHARCEACGACLPGCAYGALSRIGETWTVEAVMAEVIRDADYYDNSGGGVTLTGGEPLGQPGFALAILRACRELGIHTCLETSGFAPRRQYSQVLPFTDLFLFDYKAADSAVHQRLTGVSNQRILDNLDYLYRQGAAIILRCPLIPGINDSQEHLQGISQLSAKYPGLYGIELMAYHDMGKQKSARLGEVYALDGVRTAGEEVKQGWTEQLAELGCKRVTIG